MMRQAILLVICIVLSVQASTSITLHWQKGPELPSPRDRLGSGVVGDLFIVAGGAYWKNSEKHYLSETVAYSRKLRSWIKLPYMLKSGAYGACGVLRNKRGDEQLLVAGGMNENGATNECFRLVKQGNRFVWKRLPPLPYRLVGATGAVLGQSFYVFGGVPSIDESGIRTARPCFFVLHFNEQGEPISRWIELPTNAPARLGAAMAACGKKLYVFGGYGVQEDQTIGNFRDAWVIQVSPIIRWQRIADLPIASRWLCAIPLNDHQIGLFGGFGSQFLDKAFVYDVENDSYFETNPMPEAVAVMAYGLAKDGTIYLAGGEDEMRHRTTSFFIGRVKRE